MFEHYWEQAQAFYNARDMDTRAAITVFGTMALFVVAGFLLRCLLSFGAWVVRPTRRVTDATDVWNAMAELRTRIDNIVVPEPPETTDDQYEETDLYLAIKTLGEANTRLADVVTVSQETLRQVTDYAMDTVDRALKTIERTARQHRRTVETAVAAASPFVVKKDEPADDDDDE